MENMTPEEMWRFLVAVTHSRYDRAPSMLQVDKNHQDAILWADGEIGELRSRRGELQNILADLLAASPINCVCTACENARAAIAKTEGREGLRP